MSNKLIFLLVTVLLVLTISLTAGFFMMWNKLSALNTQGNAPLRTSRAGGTGKDFSLDTFIVNLADEDAAVI